MANLNQLISAISFGDYIVISQIFNERHKNNGTTVSSSYVGKIVRQERPATPGTAAQEVLEIAQSYLTSKQQLKRTLIAA